MNKQTKILLIVVGIILGLCLITGLIAAAAGDDGKEDAGKVSALEEEVDQLKTEKLYLQGRVKDLKNQEPEKVKVLSDECKTALTSTTQAMVDYNELVVSISESLTAWVDNPYTAPFDEVLAEQKVVNASMVEAAAQAKACYPEISVSFDE